MLGGFFHSSVRHPASILASYPINIEGKLFNPNFIRTLNRVGIADHMRQYDAAFNRLPVAS